MTKDYVIESIYKLNMQFDYGGDVAKTLNLKCPTALHIPLVSRIEELIGQAKSKVQMNLISSIGSLEKVKEMADTENVEETNQAETILEMLRNSGLFSKFCDQFKALMVSEGICLINGKDKMANAWYDDMNIKDAYGLMEKYLNDFFTL